jgi:hypothetical protein
MPRLLLQLRSDRSRQARRRAAGETLKPIWNLAEEARAGRIPQVFHESDDPHRMVPIVCKQEDFMIAVSVDPLRTNAYVFAHNGVLAHTVGRRTKLPKNWPPLSGK